MPSELLTRIRRQNLDVYRVSPGRLKEDVSQESEIAKDYRGRLVYELLQNADDAMEGGSESDRIEFTLTDDELWVGNNGRPLDEADVLGLSGIGASSKSQSDGPRRASIGHKGMGFKSVLEITDTPEAYSTTHSFRMDADLAYDDVAEVMASVAEPEPRRIPAMRFPWDTTTSPARWETARAAGLRTMFRFPLRDKLTAKQRATLASRVMNLPLTSVLFLKHLEEVRLEVATADRQERRLLRVHREEWDGSGWVPVAGLVDNGTYRIHLHDGDEAWSFILVHNAELEIGDHRGGLTAAAWEGVELSEVSLATPWPADQDVPGDWRRFHVFLPTNEPTPYRLMVNGAFLTDLSRQEVRIGDDEADYNAHLVSGAATLFRDRLVPVLQDQGAELHEVLELLDRSAGRDDAAHDGAARALHQAMVKALAPQPLLPCPDAAHPIPINRAVVPPAIDRPHAGARFRSLLAPGTSVDGRRFPEASLCDGQYSRVLRDFGARMLTHTEGVALLASADPQKTRLVEHPEADLRVDPVLDVLEGLWEAADASERDEVETAARQHPVFPVHTRPDGTVARVSTQGAACFYPPRHVRSDVPLARLHFLHRDVCWGGLLPRDRERVLEDQMVAWKAIFGMDEFAFTPVMQKSVTPALRLDEDADTMELRRSLESIESLAQICQLAGRTNPKPDHPLAYERLGSDRLLFPLSRLRVPCQRRPGAEIEWLPAYRVYFGRDWLGDATTVEDLLEAAASVDPTGPMPELPVLAPFSEFEGVLAVSVAAEDPGTSDLDDADDVGEDEDEETTEDLDERSRWMTFLEWIGVNRVLRPRHFHDVEDRGSGWLRTKDLRQPEGAAFRDLGAPWDEYSQAVLEEVRRRGLEAGHKLYFTRMHDLEALTPLMSAAANDASGTVARALFAHLADGWHRLERFKELEIAVVDQGRDPGSRTKPPRPYGDEPRKLMDDFWFWRLRQRAIVPTTHGPRRADEAWMPSTEIDRLFRRGQRQAGEFVPIVDLGEAAISPDTKRLAAALDIRPDITPSNFSPDDARVLADRLVTLYGPAVDAGTLDEDQLRTVIRQTYRSMFSLLSGSSKEHEDPPLSDAPLLVSDGDGSYRFVPGAEALYSDSGGARERLAPERPLWLFVVEAYPSATAPIQRIFGARLLRRALHYEPNYGEPALDEVETQRFRAGLDGLLPYLLARLQAERSEREQAQADANRLRKLIASIEPVDDLALSVSLDGEMLARAEQRSSYTLVRPRGDITSFVRWGTNGWPPTPGEAQALSSALADSLELNSMFEPFMALVQAPSDEARKGLLQLAGAPTDLVDVLEVAREDEVPEESTVGGPEPIVITTAPGADPQDIRVTAPPAPNPTNGHVPLYAPAQLVLEGMPIIETPGIQPSEPKARTGNGHPGANGSRPRMNLRTDISQQDALGMYVAMSFELNRLRQAGAPDDTELVFDVSNPTLLAEARARSAGVERVVQMLVHEGVSADWPGFDILTLDPIDPSRPGRMIELKSSGHNARTQDMTWNEWKTARRGPLREHFYLYLVGNLRSDLGGARPFVRAIHDPFKSILSQRVSQVTKSVQLDLRQFERAEFQELTVVEPTRPEEQHDRWAAVG